MKMKNLILMFFLIFTIQKSFTANDYQLIKSDCNNKQSDTLSHDLLLVKPLININDSNGGFYSEYYWSSFQGIYSGAIVKNIGSLISTNVYLQLDFLDYNNSVFSTYYSDTIPILNPNQIDTLKITQILTSGDWNYRIIYRIMSDSIDENEINNIDTLPLMTFYDDMWSIVSRTNVPTSTLSVNSITNFHTGDFLGVTLKTNGWMQHQLVAIEVYMTDIWPDSLFMIGKIYQNNTLIDSTPIFSPFILNDWSYVNFAGYYWGNFIYPDSTYYFGIELHSPNGTYLPIGIDTSLFHNFQTETVARINGNWTTLNYVPLIRLLCDPEEVQKTDNLMHLQLFPNPTNGALNLINVENSKIELYDMIGKLILSENSDSHSKIINLDRLTGGNYIMKIRNKNCIINKKIMIIK